MRVAFFGSSQFSCLVLRQLLASEHSIVGIVTQPDQPAGRRMTLCPTDVCREAYSLGMPILKPERLRNNADFRRQLRELKPEALLVASYGQIIPPRVLEMTQWPLNVHPSLLPKLRGASPIRTALLQGLPATGCCIIQMTPRLDDGDTLLVETVNIPADWNYSQLEQRLGEVGGRLAGLALTAVAAGSATLTAQDHSQATYTAIYTREDTWIDWWRSSREIYDFIRAWDPDVGARTLLPNGRRLKIWCAAAVTPSTDAPSTNPGTILAVHKELLRVACGQGAVELLEVQPENKRRMDVASFLAGHHLAVGDRLGRGC